MGSRGWLWLLLAGCNALLACGASSSPGTAHAAGAAGKAGSAREIFSPSDGGGSGGDGGSGSGSGGDGGNPAMPLGGTAGADETGSVALCLYPDQLPDTWSAAGAGNASSQSCVLGQLGQFVFEGCRYELLELQAFDVDPFLGGHSDCCYLSKLLECS